MFPLDPLKQMKEGAGDIPSLAEQYPELAKEWDYTRNGNLTPDQVTPSSRQSVYWKAADGHCWQCSVFNRVKNYKIEAERSL